MRALVLVAAAMVAGCGAQAVNHRADAFVDSQVGQQDAALGDFDAAGEGYFRKVDTPWLAAEPIEIRQTHTNEPPVFSQPVAFKPQTPVTLQKVAEFITKGFGITVHVTADAAEAAAGVVDGTAGRRDVQIPQGTFFLEYAGGTLKNFLDYAAARTGTSWRWDGEAVLIYYRDTRTFQLTAIPGPSEVSGRVSNVSNSGGAGGGGGESGGAVADSGQTTSATATLDAFAAATEVVRAMLGQGDSFAASASLGTITVTATPATLSRVAAFVRDTNERLTRQVALEAKLLSVELEDGASYGIDWETVYETLNGRYRIATQSLSDAPSDAGSLGISVIDSSYNYAGSSAIVRALETQGRVAVNNSAPAVSMSNRPVTVQVTDKDSYLARVETTIVPDVGATTSFEAGTVTTGFSMTLLPVVTDANDVLLHMQTTFSSLRRLRVIGNSSDGNFIEVPEVSGRDFLQSVKLRAGQTLLIGGFEQERGETAERGIGKPEFWAAGGGVNASKSRTVLVLLITPRVI